jgi:lycopene beta-cyclase
VRLALVERDSTIGGNHLWSFHAKDIQATDGAAIPGWLAGLVAHKWPSYEVRFPSYHRTIVGGYHTVTSERLHAATVKSFESSTCRELFLARNATTTTPNSVVLDDGSQLSADLVLDARGLPRDELLAAGGFQKFCGIEYACESPHGIHQPILMDATVEQRDGFRFVYVLPFGPQRLFVEDTYFSDTPTLDAQRLERRIRDYLERLGVVAQPVGRRESGVLPMPWKELAGNHTPSTTLGVRGGMFHPATAYSMPCALRTAVELSRAHSPKDAAKRLVELRKIHFKQARFARLLNLMLFRCYSPAMRVHVFEKFYELPQSTIERFYSLRLRASDRLRILSGRPPKGFSIGRAMQQRGEARL